MAWRSDTRPTITNIRKRLRAAREALAAAETLLVKYPRGAKVKRSYDAARAGRAWVEEAEKRL